MNMDDRFKNLPEQEQRQYMALALGCNPAAPDGWPNRLIDHLIQIRIQYGSAEYYKALGSLLSPGFH